MVIWKEREHDIFDVQDANDPPTVEALRNCALLKYFRVPGMKAHIWLLEYIINMWDPKKEHFFIGVHIFPIEIEDIYFLTDLSMRGNQAVLFGARGGEGSLDDIIDQHCALGIEAQYGKLKIHSIVNIQLRTVVYTIGKVVGTRSSHLTTRSHMLYALQCMEPTIFNWCESMLVCLKK